MALPRFYIEPNDWTPKSPVLSGAEAHHARDVLRLRTGDRAVLFNGRGRELAVEVSEIGSREIRFQTLEAIEKPPRETWITLAQAIPKGKNMELIVQKAVELNAAEIIPIISDRTVVSLDKKDGATKQAKWRQVVIEAAKQCGQSWLPEVREPQRLKELFGNRTAESGNRKESKGLGVELKLVASTREDALHLKEVLRGFEAKHAARPMRATILIGPEGDFTSPEYEGAQAAGFQPVTLGKIILRVETAAIYCLSVLAYDLTGENR